MVSSSVGRGATRGPPPPDRLAVLDKLVDKVTTASVLCRYARAVELAATAATHAEALFPDDSLVVAHLRMTGSNNLNGLALSASGAEQEAFARKSWALLFSVGAILVRRLETNTLLPGTIRKEELDYVVHETAVYAKSTNEPVPPSPRRSQGGAYYPTGLSAHLWI